jgi:type IV secretory pathway VirB10-like protein
MATAPLIPPAPIRRRQDRRKLGLVVCGFAVLLGGGFLIKLNRSEPPALPLASRPVQEESAMGTLPKASMTLQLPSSYSQLPLDPPARPEPTPTTRPAQTPVARTSYEPIRLTKPGPLPAPPATPPVGQPSRPPTQRVSTAKPNAPSDWLFPEVKAGKNIQEPPFPLPKEDEGSQGKRQQAERLFPQAVWAIPDDPTKVLYRSQVINGELLHHVSSDHPGEIHILVTEEVQDRFGQGNVLIPQYSTLLGKQDGKSAYGDSTLRILIDSAELPNGAVIAFNKALAGDETGATGVPGSVDNHWVQVGVAAVLSAGLSVGSRTVAGNTTGFQPTIQQDFARDVSGSFNQTGQQVIQRSLQRHPTINIAYAAPVTVQLSENVSFQTPPITTRK